MLHAQVAPHKSPASEGCVLKPVNYCAAMQTANSYRQEGNAAFAKGEFALAIDLYSNAIADVGNDCGSHTLLTNRSVAYVAIFACC